MITKILKQLRITNYELRRHFSLSFYFIFLTSCLFLSSCEKVITIDLNTVNPKMIVEGNNTNQPGPYLIKLSHSVNYYDPNVFPAVTGATVTISDNAGNTDLLSEIAPGNYITDSIKGIEGRTYFLKIVADGNTYTATSTMSFHVPIDSISFELRRNGY